MRKLELFYSMTAPSVTGVDEEDVYYSEPMMEFRDKAKDMMEKSDVTMATLKDGKEVYLAKHNFNFGKCDCCSMEGKDMVVSYSFYRVKQ